MIEPNKLFSTKNLKDWIPHYKKNGERVIDALDSNGINYTDFYSFYQKHGDMQLEFLEKMTMERVRSAEFGHMTPVQAAFLGYEALLSFMKELSAEVYTMDEEAKQKAKK